MIFTTVTVRRGTGPIVDQKIIATGVEVQIDQKSLDMMQFDGGASPYDLFDIYIAYDPGILRKDHLVDENAGTIYTVSARVEAFPDGHSECTGLIPVTS